MFDEQGISRNGKYLVRSFAAVVRNRRLDTIRNSPFLPSGLNRCRQGKHREAGTNRAGGSSPGFCWLSKNVMPYHSIFLLYPAREGVFWGAAAGGLPVPDFPCFVSGGVFLNRMRTHKGNRAWMPDLARFGMDADRGRPAACGNLSHSV